MNIKITLYKLKRMILMKIGFAKPSIPEPKNEEIFFAGHKVNHSQAKDHLDVINGVLNGKSHRFDFCEQGKKAKALYKSKESEFNILDLGSHIGSTSMYFISVFPNATIQCVEPFEGSFDFLKKNLSFHKKTILQKCFVGNHNEQDVVLYDNNNDSWAFGIEQVSVDSREIGVVEMCTFIKLMANFVSKDNFLLKVDIEGAEELIFCDKANWELINSFEVVIVEIHDWMFPGKKFSKNVLAWAVDARRDVCINGENLWFFR